MGLLLVVLPWSKFWEDNYFATAWPPLYAFVTNNFVRGGITGLGVVNLVVGFIELALALSARERSSLSFRDSSERPF